MAQFHPCVHGIYHLHDNTKSQHSAEDIEHMRASDRELALNPPAERFVLVELPCEPLAQGQALRDWLRDREEELAPCPIAISPQAGSFYGRLLSNLRPMQEIQLWLSQTAFDQYRWLVEQSTLQAQHIRDELDTLLGELIQPELIMQHHNLYHVQGPGPDGKNVTHRVYRSAGLTAGAFYYSEPDDLSRERPGQRLVITKFALEKPANGIDHALDDWLQQIDLQPAYRPADLPGRPVVLIAGLGESAMVITQIVTLLRARENRLRREVLAIWVVYPEFYPPAENGADRLETVVQLRNINIGREPVSIADLDTQDAVKQFTAAMQRAVDKVRADYAQAAPAIVLSGGRKGMAALALHIAQTKGIHLAYHSSIGDPLQEQRVEAEYKALSSRSEKQQAAFMFLEHGIEGFTLIEVPVITLST